MQRPNKQGDLILDLNPIFSNRSDSNSSPVPVECDVAPQKEPDYDLQSLSNQNDDILSTAQTTTKRTLFDSPKKSNRENALKIKDILEKYTLTQRPSINHQALSNQYRTLEKNTNVSMDYSNDLNSSSESIEHSKSFQRTNSSKISSYRRSQGPNSSFVAAYQPDLLNKSSLSQRNTVQNLKKRSLKSFVPVNRVQRPHSSTGQRQSMEKKQPSFSPDTRNVLDESLIEREYGARMETAPDIGTYSSENTKKVLVERKEVVNHFKKQGVQKFENKVLRQELERQMKMLENRVKRLTCEEMNIKKNVRKTEEVMLKTLSNKQRFHEELAQSQAVKIKRLQEEEKARERIKEERAKRENSIRNKLANAQKERVSNAIQVKSLLKEDMQKTNRELKKEEEKKQKIYLSTAEFEKASKLKKKMRQSANKSQTDENHLRFLQEEHMRMLEIEDKIQGLARKEEQLIEQIKSTHRLQVKAEGMMKKVLSTKVGNLRQAELR